MRGDHAKVREDDRAGGLVPEQDITLSSLHHEVKLGFQQAQAQREVIAKQLTAINDRLRAQELWTARLQGALVLLALLGVGNVIALLLANTP